MSRFTLPRDIYHGKGCLEELKNLKGRVFYKIFADLEDFNQYLKSKPTKTCKAMKPIVQNAEYCEFSKTEVRKLTIQKYEKH